MAKETGLGANYYLDGIDISGDTNELGSVSKDMQVIPMTGIDKSATERKSGLLTGVIQSKHFFNPTSAHPALSTLPRSDRVFTYLHRGSQLGTPGASMVAKQLGYDPNRETSGALLLSVEGQSNAFWLDWGLSLTAGKRTDGAPVNGSGVDFGADAPGFFNAQAYLHVFAFTGTSATITIQTSTDNGGGDPYTNRIAFDAVTTSPQSQRKQQTLPGSELMERWARVITAGTFSNLQFAVVLTVNRTDNPL